MINSIPQVNLGAQPLLNQNANVRNANAVTINNFAPNMVNCTNLYNRNEINEILKRLGTNSNMNMIYIPRYEVMYLPTQNSLIINNLARTNDTTEIYADGSAHHVGSWHNKEVAPKGSCTDIIEDAKRRFEASTIVY